MDVDTEQIRRALGGLVTEGLVPYNVLENGGPLLDLKMVRSRMVELDGNATEAEHAEASTQALASVLSEAVQSYRISGKSRRLLMDVLPLRADLLGTSVKARRTAAGNDLKPGKRPISAGTIRTYYEPKALEKLAQALVEMELAFREGSSPRSPAPGSDRTLD